MRYALFLGPPPPPDLREQGNEFIFLSGRIQGASYGTGTIDTLYGA